jgi:hypothetical protein
MMRRGINLVVALALLAMPVALLARIHDCATMPCCRRMCLLAHSRGAAMPMAGDHNQRLPRGFCQLSDSCPCRGQTPWGLTILILPTPPPPAQSLPLLEASRCRLALASSRSLAGFGLKPFEPPRS